MRGSVSFGGWREGVGVGGFVFQCSAGCICGAYCEQFVPDGAVQEGHTKYIR